MASPGVFLQLPHREANALAVAVNADYFDFDFIANLEHFLRIIDVIVRDFGDMHQAIGSANIDEGAEISQARNPTSTNIALLEVIKNFISDHIAGFTASGTFT